jgi:hypothetical protein
VLTKAIARPATMTARPRHRWPSRYPRSRRCTPSPSPLARVPPLDASSGPAVLRPVKLQRGRIPPQRRRARGSGEGIGRGPVAVSVADSSGCYVTDRQRAGVTFLLRGLSLGTFPGLCPAQRHGAS